MEITAILELIKDYNHIPKTFSRVKVFGNNNNKIAGENDNKGQKDLKILQWNCDHLMS